MKKVGFLLGCVLRADYGGLLRTVGTISRETGKAGLCVLADIMRCAVRYGAGFNDYLLCRFYDLTDEQRATYVTRGKNNHITAALNDSEYYHIFDSKSEFYTRFDKYLGRQWLSLFGASPEDLGEFMLSREEVIVKPDCASGGKGVERLSRSDFEDIPQMYERLKRSGKGVVEEVLVQHVALDRLYPNSVNTLRIVTILKEDVPHILYAYIRIGNSDRPVDNLHSGGMFAPVGLETGEVMYPAYDKERNTYTCHPRTGVEIQGFRIPYWEEAKALCLRAAEVVPAMRYIGWDVAVTGSGPVLVEGNNLPGYDILQMPPHTPDKIGMLPRFREFVDGI